ncbi:MAG TPA: hypothetical protein VLD37_06130 [Candidatus Bilamarchaeum sp.]|nr:hypothetical protein [Candidatus Bilamarchaeum sp.]
MPVVIRSVAFFVVLAFLLAPLSFQSETAAHSMSVSLNDSHTIAKSAQIADLGEKDSKKDKVPLRYTGAPPGLHYLPMLAMFVFIVMLVLEKSEKSREMLFLPVLFSFLAYKILFLMEENAAMDGFIRRHRK